MTYLWFNYQSYGLQKSQKPCWSQNKAEYSKIYHLYQKGCDKDNFQLKIFFC